MIRLSLCLCLFFNLTVAPLFSQSILTLATKAIESGKLKLAKNLLERARNQGESELFIDYNLGYVSFLEGDIPLAIKYYEGIVQKVPTFMGSYHNLARIYYKVEQYTSAIEVIKRAIEADDQSVENYLLVGDLYSEIDAYDLAQISYTQAIKIDPFYEDSYIALVDLYRQFGDYEKALDILDSALSYIGESNPIFSQQKAALYLYLERYIQAASVYERLLFEQEENDTSKYYLYMDLVHVYTAGKMDYMAIRTLKDMIKAYPSENDVITLLNGLYESIDRPRDAVDYYDDLFKTHRLVAYRGLRDIFYLAYENEDRRTLVEIIKVYEKNGIKDELYQVVKNSFF